MTSVSEINLVGRVIKTLAEMHSWCGETHIQKTIYIAKVIENVPFESKFVLYKHGPYSFELNTVLNYMRSQNILLVTPLGSYGSSYELNEGLWNALSRAAGQRFEEFDSRIKFVCNQFAQRKIGDLERIATAVYVYINFKYLNQDQQISKLNELKSHIGLTEAKVAFSEAEVFFRKTDENTVLQ